VSALHTAARHITTHDTRHTTHDTRHTTHNTRHTTHDAQHTTHLLQLAHGVLYAVALPQGLQVPGSGATAGCGLGGLHLVGQAGLWWWCTRKWEGGASNTQG